MNPSVEQKIDSIAADVSYMRGKYDEAIPALQTTVKEHGKAIGAIEQNQSSMAGKSGVIGAVAGSAVAGFFVWLFGIK